MHLGATSKQMGRHESVSSNWLQRRGWPHHRRRRRELTLTKQVGRAWRVAHDQRKRREGPDAPAAGTITLGETITLGLRKVQRRRAGKLAELRSYSLVWAALGAADKPSAGRDGDVPRWPVSRGHLMDGQLAATSHARAASHRADRQHAWLHPRTAIAAEPHRATLHGRRIGIHMGAAGEAQQQGAACMPWPRRRAEGVCVGWQGGKLGRGSNCIVREGGGRAA